MDIYDVTVNSSPEERKARMKEMLQREQDPAYRRALALVDEHLAALQDAEEKLKGRKRGLEVAPETGDVEKIEKAEHAVSAAEIAVAAANEAHKRLRGDYLDEPEQGSDAHALVVAASAGKKWTPEKLAELKGYRGAHKMRETAEKFGISEQRIRQLLPSSKPKASPFPVVIHRTK